MTSAKINKGMEYASRIISNKFYNLLQPKSVKKITADIASLTPARNRKFLEQIAKKKRIGFQFNETLFFFI